LPSVGIHPDQKLAIGPGEEMPRDETENPQKDEPPLRWGYRLHGQKLSLKKAGGLENSWESGGSEIQHRKIKICELFRRNLGRDLNSNTAFLRAKNFGIAQNYRYASSLLLLSYRVSLFLWVRSESTEDLWLPGPSGEFPTGIKGLRSARDGG
jgi:hypothetical protein